MNESNPKDKNQTPKKIKDIGAKENINPNPLNNDTIKSKSKEKRNQIIQVLKNQE